MIFFFEKELHNINIEKEIKKSIYLTISINIKPHFLFNFNY